MTKKLSAILTLCLLCVICAFGLNACENNDPSHTHEYTDIVVEPTCTKDGYILHLCTCGYYIKEDTTALGHNYQTEITAPTCTEQGYTTYTCTRCDNSYTDNYTDLIAHDYEWTTIIEPTETEEGQEQGICKICGDTITKIIPSLNHEHIYIETVEEPTCTTGGYTLYKCYCGSEYRDNYTAALGHNYGTTNITKEPTCTDNGERATTCSRCGDIKTQVIDALGHDYTSQIIAPACTEQGYTIHTCTRCGNIHIDDYVAALGHDYQTEIITPTCTKQGYTIYTCTRCDNIAVNDYVAAIGHDYQTETIAPTCTKQGYTAQTCSRCGDGYVNYTERLGHIYGEPIVGNKVTHIIPNYYPITLTCERCGEEQTTSAYYKNKINANCVNGGYTVYVYNYKNYIDGAETAITSYINLEHVDALSTGEHTLADGLMFYTYDPDEPIYYEYSLKSKLISTMKLSDGTMVNLQIVLRMPLRYLLVPYVIN